MKYLTLVFCALSLSGMAQKIHYKSILVDTHNDAPTACIEKKVSFDQDLKGINHSDLKRFKEGGLDYQLFSIWCDGEKVTLMHGRCVKWIPWMLLPQGIRIKW